jgi:hypothetical protein
VLLAVYELFVSVVKPRAHYTYDLYTALEHTDYNYSTNKDEKRLAVGITQGLVWADEGSSGLKSLREKHFPLALVDCGVSFKCQEGAASVVADKDKIIAEIADQTTTLNETIHGVVASGALARVLQENDERRHLYLEAVRKSSPPQQLCVVLGYNKGDSQENVTALIDALGGSEQASKCEELTLITMKATELPESLGQLTGLKYLNLEMCGRLKSLPDSMSQLVALEKLNLSYCFSLVGTVELRSGVKVIDKPDGLTVTYLSEE